MSYKATGERMKQCPKCKKFMKIIGKTSLMNMKTGNVYQCNKGHELRSIIVVLPNKAKYFTGILIAP